MISTWIEAPIRGRQGGPVRAGMWATVVVGTNPIEGEQYVWIELWVNDVELGSIPGYWIEHRGANNHWHVPVPPQPVNARLRYRTAARREGSEPVYSAFQEAVVRANLPTKADPPLNATFGPEGLVGNRMMTVRVDKRGATYDVYFPTVGLHSDVRPAHGDQYQSRAHFRAILGGLAVGRRIDWFSERTQWTATQRYQGATNLIETELKSTRGPVRVVVTDFVAMGDDLPRTDGGAIAPGQYFKRFLILNDGDETLETTFGIYVHAEINGGIGDPGLIWLDGEKTLLASNRGHGHSNRKLARDATIEFALTLDERGPVVCEAAGVNEAMLLRQLTVPARGSLTIDLLVSGAYTGWRGDPGTFGHWIRPALNWFRAADAEAIEQQTAQQWDDFVEVLPTLRFPRPAYGAVMRRSALLAALHADAEWGSVASGFDRGIEAYCLPRDAVFVGEALGHAGHESICRGIYTWLERVLSYRRPNPYWYQKYTMDGLPEWETPAIDQSAIIPWGLDRYYRRTGDLQFVERCWPLIELSALVCQGQTAHPGLQFRKELSLTYSSGIWDSRYAAFLYSNTCVVAGLRAASRLARALEKPAPTDLWMRLADEIWDRGILSEARPGGPGLVDPQTGRFLENRQQSLICGLWTDNPDRQLDCSAAIDISLLGPTVPFDLLPANDPRIRASAEAILRQNTTGEGSFALRRWSQAPATQDIERSAGDPLGTEPSSLATLWMIRYLLRLGFESGDAAAWTRAVTLLDHFRAHLGPLGQTVRFDDRHTEDPTRRLSQMPGAWGLHAMLIKTLLDFSGLEYDAPDRALTIRPILPPEWPHVGITQSLPCGEVSYVLERPNRGPQYRLSLKGKLRESITARFEVTCPGDLAKLGGWQGTPAGPPPTVDAARSRLSWSVRLAAGAVDSQWSWGPTRP